MWHYCTNGASYILPSTSSHTRVGLRIEMSSHTQYGTSCNTLYLHSSSKHRFCKNMCLQCVLSTYTSIIACDVNRKWLEQLLYKVNTAHRNPIINFVIKYPTARITRTVKCPPYPVQVMPHMHKYQDIQMLNMLTLVLDPLRGKTICKQFNMFVNFIFHPGTPGLKTTKNIFLPVLF